MRPSANSRSSFTQAVFGVLGGLALACAALVPAHALGATPQSAATPALRATPAPNPFDRTVHPLALGDRLPDATFRDQAGQTVRISDFRGRTLVIGFIYTNCADQCPLLTNKFGALVSQLPAQRFAFLEISIDPARDSTAAIANFARAHAMRAANWRILTGASALLDSFDKPLGVSVIAGGGGELLHTERTVIAGPDGRIGYFIDDAAWTAPQLAAAARKVDGLPSSALARLDLDLGKAVVAVCGGTAPGRSGLRDLLAILAILAIAGVVGLFIARRVFSPAA